MSRDSAVLVEPVLAAVIAPPRELAGPRLEGQRPLLPIQRRNPLRAMVFSAVLPGAGQFYNGQPLRGVLFAAVTLALMPAYGIGVVAWIASVLHARSVARKINAGEVWFEG